MTIPRLALVLGLSCLLIVPAFGLDRLYAPCLRHLDNPQRNLGELESAISRLRADLDALIKRPLESLTKAELASLHLDDLTEFHQELEGHYHGLLDDTEVADGGGAERKRLLGILHEATKWMGGIVYGARADVAKAKRNGTGSRFYPDVASYPDKQARDVFPEERDAVLTRVRAMVPVLRQQDYATLIREHFSYDRTKPLSDEDFTRSHELVQFRAAQWQDILAALERGEGVGFFLRYEALNEVLIRPLLDAAVPPTWEYVQMYFRPGVEGCAVWNWK